MSTSVSILLQCLKSVPSVKSGEYARKLRLRCREKPALDRIKNIMSSSDLQSADNDFVNSFPKTDGDGSMNELAICTLGCALLRIENDYGTHYNDVANAVCSIFTQMQVLH